MKPRLSLAVHGSLLAAAAAAAFAVSSRDGAAPISSPTEAVVWGGKPADVERIRYDAKGKRVSIDARADATGRFFVGTVEKDKAPDAGAAASPPTTTFVSVAAATKLTEALAPLRATRALGKLDPARAADFGLATPEATLTVRVAGQEHELTLGAATPGGADRYALDRARGELYVVKGDPLRDAESPETRLLERDPHAWKDADVTSARIEAAGKAREVARGGTEAKRFWSDPASRDKADETLGNWMSKLDRLRPTEYVAAAPEGRTVALRVEWSGASGKLGWLELVKAPGEGGKSAWFIVTERTRLHAKVLATLAEQVEADIASVGAASH